MKEDARKTYYERFSEHLPKLLQQHGMNDFSKEKILFVDFSAFEEKFLDYLIEPLTNTSSYIPELAKELDSHDQTSITMVLDSAPMKKYMEHIKSAYEKEIQGLKDQLLMVQKNRQIRMAEEGNLSQKVEQLERKKIDIDNSIKTTSKGWFGQLLEDIQNILKIIFSGGDSRESFICYLQFAAYPVIMCLGVLYSVLIILVSVYIGIDQKILPIEIIIIILTGLFLTFEIVQMFTLKKKYLMSVWNWFDTTNFLLMFTLIALRYEENDGMLAQKWISSWIIIFGYTRWVSYLRLFAPTSNKS